MKAMQTCAGVLCLALLLGSGCATPFPYGAVYTEVQFPVAATNAGVASVKKGESRSQSVMGLVATGDASIEAAARDGGITRISHVDYSARNILGVIGEYTTTVYGE